MTVSWVPRTPLKEIVRELAREGRLLDTVELLVPASQQMVSTEPSGGKSKAPAGSPAPWSARPAELVDKILRGAIRFDRQARDALGWDARMVPRRFAQPLSRTRRGPTCDHCEHESCEAIRWQEVLQVGLDRLPLAESGRIALLGLPGLVTALARISHPLGVRVDDEDRVHQGVIEEAVRRWHRQARDLIGDGVPWERLPAVPNPDHPSHAGGRGMLRRGPVCRSCSHGSCQRIRANGRRWLPWYCPRCGADSLRLDPVEGLVHCLRPDCAESGEATWTREQLYDASIDPWGDELEEAEVDGEQVAS